MTINEFPSTGFMQVVFICFISLDWITLQRDFSFWDGSLYIIALWLFYNCIRFLLLPLRRSVMNLCRLTFIVKKKHFLARRGRLDRTCKVLKSKLAKSEHGTLPIKLGNSQKTVGQLSSCSFFRLSSLIRLHFVHLYILRVHTLSRTHHTHNLITQPQPGVAPKYKANLKKL